MSELRPQQRPDLSHYTGRNVKSVVKIKGTQKWQINFVGGVKIQNTDENIPKPDGITNLQLVMVMIHEDHTRMVFGNPNPETGDVADQVEITLNPIKYSISDPRVADGKIFEPQRLDPEEREYVRSLLPQDPSQERVVEGPEEGEE